MGIQSGGMRIVINISRIKTGVDEAAYVMVGYDAG